MDLLPATSKLSVPVKRKRGIKDSLGHRDGKKKLIDLTIRPIPVDESAVHPPPPHEVLIPHENSLMVVAPKGAGKTTFLGNFLDMYAGYFHTIIIMSPTIRNDDKWDWVKQQKLLARNTELEAFLHSLGKKQDDPNTVVGPEPVFLAVERHKEDDAKDQDTFTGYIPDDCFIEEYDDSTLSNLMEEQDQMIKFLKRHNKPKHLANRICVIFDDMVGSALFSNRRTNAFKKFCSNLRHYSATQLTVSQSYKELPRVTRVNASGLILFENPNDRELELIYEENPVGMKKPQWLEVYEHATADDYSFLYIK